MLQWLLGGAAFGLSLYKAIREQGSRRGLGAFTPVPSGALPSITDTSISDPGITVELPAISLPSEDLQELIDQQNQRVNFLREQLNYIPDDPRMRQEAQQNLREAEGVQASLRNQLNQQIVRETGLTPVASVDPFAYRRPYTPPVPLVQSPVAPVDQFAQVRRPPLRIIPARPGVEVAPISYPTPIPAPQGPYVPPAPDVASVSPFAEPMRTPIETISPPTQTFGDFPTTEEEPEIPPIQFPEEFGPTSMEECPPGQDRDPITGECRERVSTLPAGMSVWDVINLGPSGGMAPLDSTGVVSAPPPAGETGGGVGPESVLTGRLRTVNLGRALGGFMGSRAFFG